MLEIASEIVICLLIAALIGFIIGYLVAKGSSKKIAPVTAEPKKQKESSNKEIQAPTKNEITQTTKEVTPKEEKTSKKKDNNKPTFLSAPKNNKKDNLTKIKGIGSKFEKQLNEMGIYHFDQIANWKASDIKWLERNTTFAHRVKRDLWVSQAKSFN